MLFHKKKELSINQGGFVQAAGVAVYFIFTGLFIWAGGSFVGSLGGF